jgi:hypothetical protein
MAARYAQPMSKELDGLLRAASEADGLTRIEYRDPIAAHGGEAVRRLEMWLKDAPLARFAVVTIVAAAAHGATAEARAAPQRAQPSDPPPRDVRGLRCVRKDYRSGRRVAFMQSRWRGSRA